MGGTMKTYRVALWIEDGIEVAAENEAAARSLAETAFRENGYDLARHNFALITDEQ